MRTNLLFDNVSAASNQTSSVINFEQRAEWSLEITTSGLDGVPKVIVELSNSGTDFFPLEDCKIAQFFFLIDDSPFGIKDDRIMGKFFRIRLEPNGNTTGTLKALLGFKTYP